MKKYQQGGTTLTPQQEKVYQQWRAKLPKSLQYEGDYDLKGLWQSNPYVKPSANLHFPDTFKLPNHPTFSNQSMYFQPYGSANPNMDQAGYWQETDSSNNYIPYDPTQKAPVVEKFQPGGSFNPWSSMNFNGADVMQSIYNPVQNTPVTNINNSGQPVVSPSSVPLRHTDTTVTQQSGPNWGHIFASQTLQNIVGTFSNASSNSRQNAAKRFNQEQFSPLNYLPANPNYSLQDYYGTDYMKEGGIHIKKSHEGKFTEYKKRTDKTTEEALHSKDPNVRKMAQFAKNARKWKHQDGGQVQDDDYDFLFGNDQFQQSDLQQAPESEKPQTQVDAEAQAAKDAQESSENVAQMNFMSAMMSSNPLLSSNDDSSDDKTFNLPGIGVNQAYAPTPEKGGTPTFDVSALSNMGITSDNPKDIPSINHALISDLTNAASSLGYTIGITASKTDHAGMTTSGNKSRHSLGDALDLGIINGVTYAKDPKKFNEYATNLASAFETMGYTRNHESGNPKAVLYGFNDPKKGGNHLNHIHISSKMQEGGMVNTTGYLDNTSTADNPFNIIPSSNITMKGVSKPIMAFPNGDSPKMMMPGENHNFPNSTHVLEMPTYKAGGEYDISPFELKRLKEMGYEFDIL